MASPFETKGIKLFGFQLVSPKREAQANVVSFAAPQNDDGAITLQTGGHFATGFDMEGLIRNEVELITRYREMSMQPELEQAVDQITNEAIVEDDTGDTVKLNLDHSELDKALKAKILKEFKVCLKLLNFHHMAHDIFRKWYIDGRLNYHVILDESKPANGIHELRFVDPRRIRKVREVEKTKDQKTGIDVIKNVQEYYLYNEHGTIAIQGAQGTRIASDSIININSGLMDSRRAMVLSYLNKAIKPLNQLRMMEDATVVYKVSRAPDRRVF